MDFDKVIACLKNTSTREVFIARVEEAGKHSSPFLHLQNSMTELKMHHPSTPRGIHQKTIIQHTLRFSDTEDCFQKFRLVCKSWKDAVETIRFNQTFDCRDLLRDCDQDSLPTNQYLEKYLKTFKKVSLAFADFEIKNEIYDLLLNNMKKLNEIRFEIGGERVQDFREKLKEFGPFISKMLQNSHKTLQSLHVPQFSIPDIVFSKLTHLSLPIGKFIVLDQFENFFPKTLKNMENLETVDLEMSGTDVAWIAILQHICENYEKHCISANDSYGDSIVPVKIVEGIIMPHYFLENNNYNDVFRHLQYAHVALRFDENDIVAIDGWDGYRENFDQCVNLKAIEFEGGFEDENFLTEILPNLSQADQEIWKERISYFQARGIRIANPNEIHENEDLRTKLAKQAGVTWRFHFYHHF